MTPHPWCLTIAPGGLKSSLRDSQVCPPLKLDRSPNFASPVREFDYERKFPQIKEPSSREERCTEVVVLGHRSATVAIRLPKHSSPDVKTMERSIKHLNIPPVLRVNSNTVSLANTEIQLTWGRDRAEKSRVSAMRIEEEIRRYHRQILEAIRSPEMTVERQRETGDGPTQEAATTALKMGQPTA